MTIRAREQLDRSVAALRGSVDLPHLLTAQTDDAVKRDVGRLARNGLAVVGFAILEEFIRGRIAELIGEANKGPVPFASLPNGLQRASTERVVSVLRAHVRLLRRNSQDPLALIQATGESLASTRGSNLSVSPLALLWEGSNLGHDDLKTALSDLGVQEPWTQMTEIAGRMGFKLRDARTTFISLQSDRHRAAHEASTDIDLITIRSAPISVLAIAAAFDALASAAVRRLRDADPRYLQGTQVRARDVALRFLDDRGGQCAEVPEGSTKAYRIHASQTAGELTAFKRAQANQEVLVTRDRVRSPLRWRVGSLP